MSRTITRIIDKQTNEEYIIRDETAHDDIDTLAKKKITKDDISLGAVDGVRIAEKTIEARNIKDKAIASENLGDHIISNDKLGHLSVMTDNIVNNQVTKAKLAEDVQNALTALDTFISESMFYRFASMRVVASGGFGGSGDSFKASFAPAISLAETGKVTNWRYAYAYATFQKAPNYYSGYGIIMPRFYNKNADGSNLIAGAKFNVPDTAAKIYFQDGCSGSVCWSNNAITYVGICTSRTTKSDRVPFYGSHTEFFQYDTNLETIEGLDFTDGTCNQYTFYQCKKLKHIDIIGIHDSIDLHWSTEYGHDDLVLILNNLATVTTTQTLTLGATNLAKLTDADKKIATDKGWALA